MPDWILKLIDLIAKPLAALIKAWQAKKVKDAMAGFRTLFNSLQEASNTIDGCHRVLLLRSENGGGIPSPGKQVYVRCTAMSRVPGAPMLKGWNDARGVDGDYMQLLTRLFEHEEVWLETAALDEGSILRGIYEKDGVIGTLVLPIGPTHEAFYYLSVNLKGADYPSAANLEKMRACAAKLSSVLGVHL